MDFKRFGALEEFILSQGKPVTTQQVAQLISQVSGEGSATVPTPPLVSPLHAITQVARSRPGSGPRDLRTQVLDVPEDKSTPVPVSKGRRGRLRLASVGVELLILGGGLVSWRRSSSPAPAEPAVAALTPPAQPPTPSIPSAATLPMSSPEGTPIQPSPAKETAPAPVTLESPSEPPSVPTKPPQVAPSQQPPKRSSHSAKPTSVAKGTVEFRIRPYATIFLDGNRLGETPLPPLDKPAGRYTVKVVNAELGKTVQQSIEVRAEQTTLVTVNLLKE
jgi:hypothetical protein